MPFLVPNVLLLAVPLDGSRVLLAIPPPVLGIAGPPFLRAVQAHLAVFGVPGDLLAVVIGAAAPLAAGVAAYRLPRLIFRWLEGSFTVAASPFDHTAGCRTGSYAISRRGDLETAIEWVPRPRRWLVFFDYKTGGIAVVLNRRQQLEHCGVALPEQLRDEVVRNPPALNRVANVWRNS